MFTSIPINSTFKKFMFLYVLALVVMLLILVLVYNIYITYLSNVIRDLARNPVMIHDTFSLRQSIVPLIKDDVLGIRIYNAENISIFEHSQNTHTIFALDKVYKVTEKENLLYKFSLKMSLKKYVLILFFLSFLMLFAYYPFLSYERKETQNQNNQFLAGVSKKLAHDIRSPISTLNLISSKITDPRIKELQQAVVAQINLIADDLLYSNRAQDKKSDVLAKQTYADLLIQIKKEYNLKFSLSNKSIIFSIDKSLKKMPAIHSKIIYPIICNSINNSIEAVGRKNGKIEIQAQLHADVLSIIIKDNGIGIPEDILVKLGHQVISHGKLVSLTSGNGIALFNAKKDITSIGGSFNIRSVVHEYTKVEINIPI